MSCIGANALPAIHCGLDDLTGKQVVEPSGNGPNALAEAAHIL
jgi:hypothetical protein